jgi:hypothetical protein
MPTLTLLDYIPLWAVFAATVLLMALSLERGFRLGTWRRNRSHPERESSVGAVVGATLALLGFMLAITFGIAVSRFDMRTGAYLNEIDIISTTYLRADFLGEEARNQIRQNLKEYVGVRLHAIDSGDVRGAIKRSEEIHQLMWATATSALQTNDSSLPLSLFVESVNELIDVHSRRIISGIWLRIPPTIWFVLYAIAFLGMGEIGYQTALGGSSRTPIGMALIVAFASSLWLIADLARPHEGVLRVNQQAMRDLESSMR